MLIVVVVLSSNDALPPNLAQNFPFRVQIGLPYPRSSCGPLSGPTDLAWAHEVVGRESLGATARSPQGEPRVEKAIWTRKGKFCARFWGQQMELLGRWHSNARCA